MIKWMEILHRSVLLNECLEYLSPNVQEALFIDGTLGEGGHTEAFLSKYIDLRAVGIDADPDIQKTAKERLLPFGERAQFFLGWSDDFFSNYPSDLPKPDLILFDLGISIFHYTLSGRGFSFRADEPLDMRVNPREDKTAADIVNTYSEKELADLIYAYGEERYSRAIARAIVAERNNRPFINAAQLAETIFLSVPVSYRHGRIHPATRTFQALRISVNEELDRLPRLLDLAFQQLEVNGKMGVITFHSLEDRIVKTYFRELGKSCICPPEMPICKCGGQPRAKVLTKKSVSPTKEEVAHNPPSRSARLRVVKKVPMRMV